MIGFLANYTRKVLNQERVTIIHEDLPYGSYLANVFEAAAGDLGLQVVKRWEFRSKDPSLKSSLAKIVANLKREKDSGAIFLATHVEEGSQLVKLIKDAQLDNQIITPDSFAGGKFLETLASYPLERDRPGYYSDGIYVTTPLIFDIANEQAQLFKRAYEQRYGESPIWHAAYAYDSAKILVEALKHSGVEGSSDSLQADRQKVKNFLAGLTGINKALEGVTGINYFDKQGNSQKPVTMGVFQNQQIISASTQLHQVRNLKDIPNIQQALAQGQILKVDNRYMYKTNVVYTGIKVNQLRKLDMNNQKFEADFYLWFRFQGDFKPEDISFLNAVEPVILEDPIKQKEDGLIKYQVYHVQATFRADYLKALSFERHVLGFNFRHNTLKRNQLIYIPDVMGMEMNGENSLLQKMKKERVLEKSSTWSMEQLWFFQDEEQVHALGDPSSLGASDYAETFSRFNMGIQIKRDELNIWDLIPRQYTYPLFFLSLFLVCTLTWTEKKYSLNAWEKPLWLSLITAWVLLLSSSEVLLLNWLVARIELHSLTLIVICIEVL